MIEWISENKEWLLSGVGVTIFLGAMKFLSKYFTKKKTQSASTNINQTINIETGKTSSVDIENKSLIQQRSKGSISILFIDDNKVSFIPAMKKAGYSQIKYIKDCNNIHCPQILDADIIFVDVNGVGVNLFPQEQGFGLAKAIKAKFPNKCVVLYSAEPQYFRKDYSVFDSVLAKNSEPYEFTKIIDDWKQGLV